MESPASARPFTLFPLIGLLRFESFGFLISLNFLFALLFLLAVAEVSHGPEVEKGMVCFCFCFQKMAEKTGPLVQTIGGSEKNLMYSHV